MVGSYCVKLKLLLRRLTVSAPRMAVRSALPWPLRWVSLALVAGFCAALALWAFELGKDLAGLGHDFRAELSASQAQVQQLQGRLEALRTERDKAREVANTAETLVTAEKVARERLSEINQRLTDDVQRLRADLGFFEQFVATSGKATGAASIRGLQVKIDRDGALQWQALVVQTPKDEKAFEGELDLEFIGVKAGRRWSQADAGNPRRLSVTQYGRVSGQFLPPAGVKINTVTAQLRDGRKVIATETARL